MDPRIDDFPDFLHETNRGYANEVPSGSDAHAFVDKTINLLFPFRTKSDWSMQELDGRLKELQAELETLMQPLHKKLKMKPAEICGEFMHKLPGIYKRMMKDADAFMQFDPAAESIDIDNDGNITGLF